MDTTLKTHKSVMVREWLENYPLIDHAFIPKGAARQLSSRRGGDCSGDSLRRENYGVANIGFESFLMLVLYLGSFAFLLTAG